MTGTTNVDNSTLAALLGILGTFSLVIIAVAIIWYVFAALGFYKMAKNRGISYAWIAWIPICQYYLLGDLIGNHVWGFGYANWILIIGTLISSIGSSYVDNMNTFGMVILLIFVVAFFVYEATAYYKLYKLYSEKPVLLLVLSIIFPFLIAIFLFSLRNNQPKENVAV